MLTAHERLTAREPVIALYVVVLAHAKAGVRFRCAHDPRKAPFVTARTPVSSSRTESASPIRPTSAIQHPQNPSRADRNPIGRSPRPSQTPATYFKRPYRNCPDETALNLASPAGAVPIGTYRLSVVIERRNVYRGWLQTRAIQLTGGKFGQIWR